jgi:SAM-dependent methyltransferase
MPLQLVRPQLFPDDTNPLPAPGSREQHALIEDELEIGNETYLERLQQFSSVTDNIYPELVAACRDVVAQTMPDRPLRVLDLCSGIGMVSLMLLNAGMPISSIALVDISAELMERAQRILRAKRGASLPPLTTHRADLLVGDLRERVEGKFDLVVTCNAFQHFPKERQAELFRQIRGLLSDDGVFVFCSHFKRLRPDWKGRMIAEYQDRMRTLGAPETAVAGAATHISQFHNYANLIDAYNWMEAAEFSFYECVFRKDEVAVLAAVK